MPPCYNVRVLHQNPHTSHISSNWWSTTAIHPSDLIIIISRFSRHAPHMVVTKDSWNEHFCENVFSLEMTTSHFVGGVSRAWGSLEVWKFEEYCGLTYFQCCLEASSFSFKQVKTVCHQWVIAHRFLRAKTIEPQMYHRFQWNLKCSGLIHNLELKWRERQTLMAWISVFLPP